jgi:hypothetical protein
MITYSKKLIVPWIVAALFAQSQATSAMSQPRMFEEFVKALPDSEFQSAFCLEKPVWLDAHVAKTSFEERFAQWLEQDLLGDLADKVRNEHYSLRHVWVWTDLTRQADDYVGRSAIDGRDPTIAVFSFNAVSAAGFEGIAKLNAAQLESVAGARIFKFKNPENDGPMFIAFRNNAVFVSTERRLLEQFLSGSANQTNAQRLLASPAWRPAKHNCPVWGIVLNDSRAKHPESWNQTSSFEYLTYPDRASIGIKGHLCKITYWDKEIKIPEQESSYFNEFGGRSKVSSPGNRTVLDITSTDEESTESWIFFLAVMTQGACI